MDLTTIINQSRSLVGGRRAFALGLALLILVVSGISVFHTPEYEIIYDRLMRTVANTDGSRTVLCSLDIGNTGKEPQTVEIHFKRKALENIILPIKARNYGFKDRPTQKQDSGDAVIYTIEDVEPEKQVEVRVVLRIPADESLPDWDDVLVMIRPEKSRALTGSPGMIKLMRFFYIFV